jgi:hypothetical protein
VLIISKQILETKAKTIAEAKYVTPKNCVAVSKVTVENMDLSPFTLKFDFFSFNNLSTFSIGGLKSIYAFLSKARFASWLT